MSQVLYVFDRNNTPIGQINANVTVAWYYNRPMSTSVGLAQRHEALDYSLLLAGNRMLVLSDDLPPWVGVILPPEAWGDTQRFTLHSAEKILEGRLAGANDSLTGSAGEVFANLLASANRVYPTGITAGLIDYAGGAITREYHYDKIADAMDQLATDLSSTWWVSGGLDGSRLVMQANWARERGRVFAQPLIEGVNLGSISNYGREGFFANRIRAVGQTDDWQNPLVSDVYEDTASQARNGVVEYAIMAVAADDKNTLNALAASALARFRRPRHALTAAITTPPYPEPGDQVTVELSTLGFDESGAVGASFTGRVREMSYDPASDEVLALIKEDLYDESLV